MFYQDDKASSGAETANETFGNEADPIVFDENGRVAVSNQETEADAYEGIKISPDGKSIIYVDEDCLDFVCEFVELEKLTFNLSLQKYNLNFRHISKATGERYFEMSYEDLLGSNPIKKWAENAFIFNPSYAKAIFDYMLEDMHKHLDNGNVQYLHSNLGWAKDGMENGYLAGNSVGTKFPSTLEDNEGVIGSNGDKDVYDAMLKKEVFPVKNLHLPVAIAFTSPIVPLLAKRTNVHNLMINLVGMSSKGKSTSNQLIASFWGRPRIDNRKLSVCKTFSSTLNGMEKSLLGRIGFPIIFDDVESNDNISYTEAVYRLIQGSEKVRQNVNREAGTWSTCISISAENSLLERGVKKRGLIGRIIELQDIPLTTDVNNNNAILRTISENYGFYGELFAEQLLKFGQKNLESLFEEVYQDLSNTLESNGGIEERLKFNIAIVLTAARLVKQLLDFPLDEEFIKKVLVDNEMQRRSAVPTYEAALEEVFQFVAKHSSKFTRTDYRHDERNAPTGIRDHYGKIYTELDEHYIAVLSECVDSILSKYNDRMYIKRAWRDKGVIVTYPSEPNRFTKRIKVGDGEAKTNCYVFKVGGGDNVFKYIQDHDDADIFASNSDYFFTGALIKKATEYAKSLKTSKRPSAPIRVESVYKERVIPDTPVIESDPIDEAVIDAIFQEGGEQC